MAGGRLVLPSTDPVLTSAGLLNVGATLTVYQTGTTNLASIFADIGLVTPIANPQTSNAAGRFYTQSTQICADESAAYDCVLALTDGETFTYTAVYTLGAPVNTSGFLQNPNVALTGVPTAPTPAANDASSKIATTQFVSSAIAGVSFVPSGSAGLFFMASLPTGWLLCDGSAVSRTSYAGLFSAIGTTYGTGDGTTTFNLPDCRGYFLRGLNTSMSGPDSGRTIGSTQGFAMQGHLHYNGVSNNNGAISPYGVTTNGMPGSATGCAAQNAGGTTDQGLSSTPQTDGSHGTPAVASETRPINLALCVAIHT
jgi:microcystin-dependent protein